MDKGRAPGSLLAVVLLLLATAVNAQGASFEGIPNSPAGVTEFRLSSDNLYPRHIARGADGGLWFSAVRGVGRMGLDGQATEFPTAGAVSSIAAMPDGVWFTRSGHVGKVGPDGAVTEFPLPTGYSESDIAAGPDGNLWITKREDSSRDAILRVTPNGQVTQFELPHKESGPKSITTGPDGNLWFTEYFGSRIGRITPTGQLTEWPVSSSPIAIATGPDGNLWFVGINHIGRMTPSGHLSTFPVEGAFGPIAAGPDGRLWFHNGYGTIGRITPGGRLSQVKLPFEASDVTDIVAGVGDEVWYTAIGDYPCAGGGLTCMQYVPDSPGIVGRITPGPLTVRIGARGTSQGLRWVKLRLRCLGGHGSSICRGRLALSAEGARVAQKPYRLAVDSTKPVTLRLTGEARRSLLRDRRLSVVATATLEQGDGASRKAVIRFARGQAGRR